MIKQSVAKLAYARVPKTARTIDRDYYGTPPQYVDMAREVMDGITLDPASCEEANRRFVRARRYYSREDDGLSKSWRTAKLWLNPPYSGKGCYEFARKFNSEAPGISQAIVLVNSATGTRAFRYLFDACDAICFCSRRIQFINTNGEMSQMSNTKEQLFFYRGSQVERFRSVFGTIGKVVRTQW